MKVSKASGIKCPKYVIFEYLRPGFLGQCVKMKNPENGLMYHCYQAESGQKQGIIVAVGNGRPGEYRLGWCLLSPAEPEWFGTPKVDGQGYDYIYNRNWSKAFDLALKRATEQLPSPHLRGWAKGQYGSFCRRAASYFKNA